MPHMKILDDALCDGCYVGDTGPDIPNRQSMYSAEHFVSSKDSNRELTLSVVLSGLRRVGAGRIRNSAGAIAGISGKAVDGSICYHVVLHDAIHSAQPEANPFGRL